MVGLNGVVAVAAGGEHSLALRQDGTVVAWGSGSGTASPTGITGAVRIAAGYAHSLALKADGTVAAWGDNSYGQTNVPVGLTDVVAIAAGDFHSLALKRDGTVVAWGYNEYGQASVPGQMTGVVTVATGGDPADGLGSWGGGVVQLTSHSLALRGDGTVIAMGVREYLDNSFSVDFSQSGVPSGLGGVIAVAVAGYHNLALKQDGTVIAWGEPSATNVPAGLSGVVSIAVGQDYVLAVVASNAPSVTLSDGTLWQGLTAWWTLDGDDTVWTSPTAGMALDSSGGGAYADLTLHRFTEASATIPGKIGEGLSFDGSAYAITDASLGDVMGGGFGTISLWFYALPGNTGTCGDGYVSSILSDTDGGANGGDLWLGCNGSLLCAGGASSVSTYVISTAVNTGAWNHAVWVNGNGVLSLWLNGAFIGAKEFPGLKSTSYQITLGKSLGNNSTCIDGLTGCFFKGYIDDVRVYNRGLSPSEIQDLFQLRSTAARPSISMQPANRIVQAGQTVTFSVGADGQSPLSYQWLFDGNPLRVRA